MRNDAEKKMKKYIAAVKRRLALPANVKKRVMNDFVSSIRSRRESGKTDEEILAELGTPAEAAAELNAQMKEFAYSRSPWRWVCLGIAAVSAVTLALRGSPGLIAMLVSIPLRENVGLIGGVDGPTQIIIAQSQESMLQGMVLPGILLVMGLVGFFCLGRVRNK